MVVANLDKVTFYGFCGVALRAGHFGVDQRCLREWVDGCFHRLYFFLFSCFGRVLGLDFAVDGPNVRVWSYREGAEVVTGLLAVSCAYHGRGFARPRQVDGRNSEECVGPASMRMAALSGGLPCHRAFLIPP